MHDWFNAKAAALLVEASQLRVSKKSLTMDNTPEPERPPVNTEDPAQGGVDVPRNEFEEDEAALADVDDSQQNDSRMRDEDESDENDLNVMETFATQTQTIRQSDDNDALNGDEDDDDDLVAVGEDEEPNGQSTITAPPVFRPLTFDQDEMLQASVKRRLRKGHEAVLEEQPKWSLLAKVLKEIEDTIARVQESHAGQLARAIQSSTVCRS